MDEKRRVTVDGETFEVELSQDGNKWTATIKGHTFEVQVDQDEVAVPRKRKTEGRKTKSGNVSTTIPGKVVTVEVTMGQSVQEGDVILVLEAMKMQNEISAPSAGSVRLIHVSEGEAVSAGAKLVELKTPKEG